MQALCREQAFHAIPDAHAVLRRGDEFTMPLPTVLSVFTRHPDHPQRGGLTIHVPKEQREESFDSKSVGSLPGHRGGSLRCWPDPPGDSPRQGS
jgi:hypothetical protein